MLGSGRIYLLTKPVVFGHTFFWVKEKQFSQKEDAIIPMFVGTLTPL